MRTDPSSRSGCRSPRLVAVGNLLFLILCLGAPPATVAAGAQPLTSPVRITLTPWGEALVSDYSLEAVIRFASPTGGEVLELDRFAVRGKPSGLAWADHLLFVGNDTSGSIEIHRLHKNGRWQHHGRLGRRGEFRRPTDLAADEIHRLLFVLSAADKRLEAFNFEGELLGTLAAGGEGETALVNPTALTADPFAREVYVSDYGDPAAGILPAVRIYGYDGSYRGEISGETEQPGFAFSRPQGLASDGVGHLFLVDALLGQVLIFDRASGWGVATLGSYGSGPGQLLLPLDIALDPLTGDVLVTDNRNARVVVFAGTGR